MKLNLVILQKKESFRGIECDNSITKVMDTLASMNMELSLFISQFRLYMYSVRTRSDKDRFIQHYLFDAYIKFDLVRNYGMCAIVKELSDKFTVGGRLILNKELKQLENITKEIPV